MPRSVKRPAVKDLPAAIKAAKTVSKKQSAVEQPDPETESEKKKPVKRVRAAAAAAAAVSRSQADGGDDDDDDQDYAPTAGDHDDDDDSDGDDEAQATPVAAAKPKAKAKPKVETETETEAQAAPKAKVKAKARPKTTGKQKPQATAAPAAPAGRGKRKAPALEAVPVDVEHADDDEAAAAVVPPAAKKAKKDEEDEKKKRGLKQWKEAKRLYESQEPELPFACMYRSLSTALKHENEAFQDIALSRKGLEMLRVNLESDMVNLMYLAKLNSVHRARKRPNGAADERSDDDVLCYIPKASHTVGGTKADADPKATAYVIGRDTITLKPEDVELAMTFLQCGGRLVS